LFYGFSSNLECIFILLFDEFEKLHWLIYVVDIDERSLLNFSNWEDRGAQELQSFLRALIGLQKWQIF
jgi:hypothetical protein